MTDPQLYIPRFNQMSDRDVHDFVTGVGTAHLITVGEDGLPDATFLPIIWDGDRVLGHLARANPHWRRVVTGSSALLVVSGKDTYVSPSWYASKREHGRVVPTWNYSTVHLRGTVRIHDDAEWVGDMVTRLTDLHESGRKEPWQVSDAPEDYVTKNLHPIVGVDVLVESVEAKAKLSQNRSEADRQGVAAGLRAEGADPDGLVAH